MWTNKTGKRIYVNAAGQVVPEDDPTAATLLVGEGGELPLAEARKYGLVEENKEDKEDGDPGDEQPEPEPVQEPVHAPEPLSFPAAEPEEAETKAVEKAPATKALSSDRIKKK